MVWRVEYGAESMSRQASDLQFRVGGTGRYDQSHKVNFGCP